MLLPNTPGSPTIHGSATIHGSPAIRLVIGTTYRDLHSEREYLLKRILPQLKRECEQKGILLSTREIKWADEPTIVAKQLNALIEQLHDEITIYLGLTTSLQPTALSPAQAAGLDLDSCISREFGSKAIELLKQGGSWQALERTLALAMLGSSRATIIECATDPGSTITPPEAIGSKVLSALRQFVATRYPEPAADSIAENYHRLYLRSRTIDSLQSASYASELLLAMRDHQCVVLVGSTGSGKSTTLGLALDALSINGTPTIPYVMDGDQGSSRAIARHVTALLEPGRGVSSVDPHAELSLALSRTDELVLAIDGIEFLDQHSRYLGWLPHPLPKNVKVVASTSDLAQGAALEERGWKVIGVSALSADVVRDLVEHLCWKHNLWMTREQKAQICEHPLAFHPQFLITLFDELGQFGWFGQLNKNLDEYLDEMSVYHLFASSTGEQVSDTSLPTSFILSARLQYYLQSHSLVELYQKVLERIEFDLGVPQLTRVLSYIASSNLGLRIKDICLLAGMPPEAIQHILHALSANLVTRRERIQFGNEYFGEAVRKRYLSSRSVQHAVRTSLIHHLRRDLEHDLTDGGSSADYRSSAEELASQYHSAKDEVALRDLLLDPRSISRLLSELQQDTLARYWQTAQMQDDPASVYLQRLREQELQMTPEATVHLLRQLSDFLLYIGRSTAARQLLESALSVAEEQSGMQLASAAILRSLGKTHYLLARYLDSEKAYRASLHLFIQAGSVAEAEVLIARKDLAQLLAEGARYAEAEEIYDAILDETERRYGAKSPEFASALSSMAFMFNGQGRYHEAILAAKAAQDIYVHHWGWEYPELGWCYHSLATAFRQLNDLAEAEKWYSLAIARFAQMFGEEHSTPLRSMYGLAVLYQRKGDIPAAVAQTRKVLELRIRLLGSTHADTAAVKVLLGSLLRSQGQYEEALALLVDAMEIFDSGANKEHPEVARTLHELGDVYEKLGSPEKARACLARALDIRSKVLGKDHPDTCATQALLSRITSAGSEVVTT